MDTCGHMIPDWHPIGIKNAEQATQMVVLNTHGIIDIKLNQSASQIPFCLYIFKHFADWLTFIATHCVFKLLLYNVNHTN